MIWLAWRQFRGAALLGLLALSIAGGYLIVLGLELREKRRDTLAACGSGAGCEQNLVEYAASHENTLLLVAAATYLAPVVLGMFWGAPLVAAELEHGTHKLVWNQSVTRRRWLFTRMALVLGAAAILAGVLAAMFTWAVAPVDDIADNRFDAVAFGSRHLVPVAYAVLAVSLGVLAGAILRRRLPAMALTAAVFVLVQFLVPNLVRPHLMPAETEKRQMTAEAVNEARSLGSITGAPVVGGLRVPDAWVSDTSPLRTEDGSTLSSDRFDRCLGKPPEVGAGGTFGDTAVCLGRLDLHVELIYHPNSRYWAFQLMEFTLYALMALLAAAASLRSIQRRNS